MDKLTLESFHHLEVLPSLPIQTLNVLNQIEKISALDYDIVEMIKYDASIACQVLKIANGPLFGHTSRVSSLQQASVLLGPGAIKNIILTTPILERFSNPDYFEEGIDYTKIWMHGAVTAGIAVNLSKLLGQREPEVCFTAGLIHDLGKIALAVLYPKGLSQVLKIAREKKTTLPEAEKEVLGFTHHDIGGLLAERWGFPHELIDVVADRRSHEPETVNDKLPSVVQLARYIAFELGCDDGMDPRNPVDCQQIMVDLGIDDQTLETWKPQLQAISRSITQSMDQ